jgi:hypothetical protein
MSREQIAGVLSEVLADYGEGLSGCAFDEIVDRLSQPQAASSTQAAEPLAERLQRQCVEWGAYWRAPDAHGVILTPEQATELLRDALGVEVEITASSTTPGSTGAVDALPAKWRNEADGFSDGDASARRACAAELEAAIAQPAQQGERE